MRLKLNVLLGLPARFCATALLVGVMCAANDGNVRGVVLGGDGLPVSSARVVLHDLRSHTTLGLDYSGVDGSFSFASLDVSSEYHVYVEDSTGFVLSDVVKTAVGASVVVTLKDPKEIQSVSVRATGKDLPEDLALVVGDFWGGRFYVTHGFDANIETDKDGFMARLPFAPLGTERYIRVSSAGYNDRTYGPFFLPERHNVDLALRKSGTGVVVVEEIDDAVTCVVAQRECHTHAVEAWMRDMTVLDCAGGDLEFHLASGDWIMLGVCADRATRVTRCTVRPNDEVRLALNDVRGATLGRIAVKVMGVRSLQGVPDVDVWVTNMTPSCGASNGHQEGISRSTDRLGKAAFDVTPGKYIVQTTVNGLRIDACGVVAASDTWSIELLADH